MKTIFYNKLTKVLLLMLFCCPFAVTQLSYIKYPQVDYWMMCYTKELTVYVKDGYYNDELFNKLETPPYSTTYSIVSTSAENRDLRLDINGYLENINIFDHISKLEKEEFVDRTNPTRSFFYFIRDITHVHADYTLKGQVIQDGKPLPNHIVNVFTKEMNDSAYVYNCITDENGNYYFYELYLYEGSHTVSTKIGNIRYDTTLIVEKKQGIYPPQFTKIIDFNDGKNYMIGTDEPAELPTTYSLSQNYPNPFNPTTKIEYSLPEASMVRLSVYNSLGQEIAKLVDGYQSIGKYNVDFNAANLPSGIYFYRLQSDKFTTTKKMMLIK